jgi:hypothetical protein
MQIPLWVYDYKLKKYVVFPFHLLKTFDDGKLGIGPLTFGDKNDESIAYFLRRFGYLFKKERYIYRYNSFALNGLDGYRYLLKDHVLHAKPKESKCRSKNEKHITKLKHKRPSK